MSLTPSTALAIAMLLLLLLLLSIYINRVLQKMLERGKSCVLQNMSEREAAVAKRENWAAPRV